MAMVAPRLRPRDIIANDRVDCSAAFSAMDEITTELGRQHLGKMLVLRDRLDLLQCQIAQGYAICQGQHEDLPIRRRVTVDLAARRISERRKSSIDDHR